MISRLGMGKSLTFFYSVSSFDIARPKCAKLFTGVIVAKSINIYLTLQNDSYVFCRTRKHSLTYICYPNHLVAVEIKGTRSISDKYLQNQPTNSLGFYSF